MGIQGFLIVIGIALLAGLAARFVLPKATNFEAIVVATAALFGMLMGSEMITDGTFIKPENAGPVVDGLLIVPAVILALVLIAVSEFFVRTDQRRTA